MEKENNKNLKQVAKESEEKGFKKAYEIYKKFDKKVDETLSKMIDEKPEQKLGLIDLWKKIKRFFNKEKEVS